MVSFPHCKINLGLNVVRKREDGYHDIATCFFPVLWTDILEVIPSEKLEFKSSGDSIPGDPQSNLCLKAYTLLKDDFDIPPVKIHLHKIIPIGAGLGGGSSDGAFVLRMINDMFRLNLSVEQLAKYASALGSDCAFFVQDRPMIGTGRGDELTPARVDISGAYIVIVKPEIHVSTAEAYSGVKPTTPSEMVQNILAQPLSRWKKDLVNDFEASVFLRYPQIGSIKKQLYDLGAEYASMSGSGSSVFGIFKDDPKQLVAQFQSLRYWKGQL